GENGVATVTLTSTRAQTVPVSVQSGSASATQNAHFTATDVVASHLVLSVTKDNALADGSSDDTVVATLTDSNDRPVSGKKVSWTVPVGVTVKGGDAVSDSSGKITVQLLSTVSGDVKVSGASGGLTAETTAHFTATDVVVSHLALSVTKDNALADGSATDTVVATLTDSNDRPVTGKKVSWTVPSGVAVKGGDAVSDSSGKVTVQLTSTVSGDVKVSGASGGLTAEATAHFSEADDGFGSPNLTVKSAAQKGWFNTLSTQKATFIVTYSGIKTGDDVTLHFKSLNNQNIADFTKGYTVNSSDVKKGTITLGPYPSDFTEKQYGLVEFWVSVERSSVENSKDSDVVTFQYRVCVAGSSECYGPD
ncbi:hypothetical protein NG99_02965, partial [Erwinia typographi]